MYRGLFVIVGANLLELVLLSGLTQAAIVRLSASQEKLVPLEAYTCEQKVYAHVHLDPLAPGPHELEAVWHLPNGKVQENTRLQLKAPAQDAVLWLEAARPAILSGPVGWTGGWNLEIRLDGKPLGNEAFQMTC
jgi:hypothetical protein